MRKQFRRKRKRFSRGYGSNFANNYKAVSKYTNWNTIWTAINNIKSLINVERKFLDVSITPAAVDKNNPTIDWLSSISEGNDYNNRQGISVKSNSLFLRGYLTLPSTATVGHVVRFILFLDLEGLGTAPTASDLLETSTDVNSPLNHFNGKRFKVLYDRLHVLSISGPEIKPFKVYKKCGHHIRWSNSTTATREGHIYAMYLSDTHTTTEQPLLGYDSRLRFVDN